MNHRFWRTGTLATLVALAASGVAPTTSADAIIPSGRTAARIAAASPWLGQHASTFYGVVYRPLRASATGASDPGTGPQLGVQVTDSPTGQAMPAGFLGLSIEYHTLIQYVGGDPANVDPVFLALIRALDPGQSPVLRIGGNSTDETWWPLAHTRAPKGVNFDLSVPWMRMARALATDLDARLILGINLAANSTSLAAVEARELLDGVGRQYIDALEIGNEPDGYNEFAWYYNSRGAAVFARPTTYDEQDFSQQFARWRTVLPAGAPIAGPAYAEGSWMSNLPSFLTSEPGLGVVTFHRYPLRGCEYNPTLSDYASIPNLLSDSSSSGMAAGVAPFVSTAHAAGVPFRLDELNSASCTGRFRVSNTFASALWAVDTLFNMASVGVDGINIHTLPGTAYEPFQVSQTGSRWSAVVKPLYYGLLMFARAFPPGAHLLSVTAPTGPVKAWATQAPNGQIRVVLINKDPTTSFVVHLQMPGGQTPLTSESLSAPAVNSTTGVTLGGESFGSSTRTGVLPVNPNPPTVSASGGSYAISLPAASAVMLTG